MKKLLLLLILSLFSAQGYAGSCPDGSEPTRSVSADGSYFVYNCGDFSEQAKTSITNFPHINLPRDVASGNIYQKSLQDPDTYKDYGVQIVDKKDGHPVRAGNKSLRFELRDGDCGEVGSWSDCDSDRERHELTGSKMLDGEEWWYAWSIFMPKDFKNISPTNLDLGQFHGDNSWVDLCCSFMFKNAPFVGYSIENHLDDYKRKQLLTIGGMSEKWNDILVNLKWSKNNDGFINLWVNNKLVYEYQGPTLTKNSKFVYFKFGIYRSGLSRYLNHKNFSPAVETCFRNNGASNELINVTKKGERSGLLGLGADAPTFNIYNQCKHLYTIKMPTHVVYYDEVRAGKTKEEVVGSLPLRIK
jgi:hypothetical protein